MSGRAMRFAPRMQRRGVTLIELLVVLVLLSIVSGVAVVSHARAWSVDRRTGAGMMAKLTAARAAAVRSGKVVTLRLDSMRWSGIATALPDGRLLCDSLVESVVRCDQLTGRTTGRGDSSSLVRGVAP